MTGDGSLSDKDCVPGSTVVGYMGGTGTYPTYANYTTGNNYSETLRLEFDGESTKFSDLLAAYWRYADTSVCDDPAYCPRIFYVDADQKQQTEASLTNHPGSLLAVLPAAEYTFWKAEEYHQNFNAKSGAQCGGSAHPSRRNLALEPRLV